MRKHTYMSSIAGCFLVLFLGPLTAPSAKSAAAQVRAKDVSISDPSDLERVTQVELGMGAAMVAVDIAKLSQIYADDWVNIGDSGKTVTKKQVLQYFQSGRNKLVSYELGPMDVKVFGDVAVAHGNVTEKRLWDGKDIGGEFVWMDLLRKRAGKWVCVRSAGARVN